MEIKYIVVQAGGKGSRLKKLTKNKPKALVPINNLPMIFHLFNKYPNSKFIIIGDYKFNVLEKYLNIFSTVDKLLINSSGHSGTCAGIKNAIENIPEKEQFMLIWSDLVLTNDLNLPKNNGNYIGIAKNFTCRWKYEHGTLIEEPSNSFGVAGLFLFEDKNVLKEIPIEGEFVHWLKESDISLKSFDLYDVKEYGVLSEYKNMETFCCRPFNRIYERDNILIKEAIDNQGKELAIKEAEWYKYIKRYNFKYVPNVYSFEPLRMEKIKGKAICECTNIERDKKEEILLRIVKGIRELHDLEEIEFDYDSCYDAYIGKTCNRLNKIKELVPLADKKEIKINGVNCRNIFYYRRDLERIIQKYYPRKFKIIHGDCTFSNIMLKEDNSIVLIDPREYFGKTKIFGDQAYDWAKLYYSLKGNYDQFNRKKFDLEINENEIELSIDSNGWETLDKKFFEIIKEDINIKQIKLIHSIIWLSLTTYAWENYDSICGAFYNGLYYLEDALNEELF